MPIEIKLTQGYVAIVDEVDADLCNYSWAPLKKREGLVYARGYMPGGQCLMHRVILMRILGVEALHRLQLTDHKNLNGLDNRRENLRLATYPQNLRNTRLSSRNTTGVKGVSFNPKTGKYYAQMYVQGRYIWLGSFDTLVEAGEARKRGDQENPPA